MSLFDLFGITAEEQRQAQPKPSRTKQSKGNGKNTSPKPKKAAAAPTLDLFSQNDVNPSETVPSTQNEKMTEEEARQEAVYASLDWDTNPPINGFYESMMALGVEGRARLRQRIREQKATQPELFYTQEDTPKTQAQERRPQHDTGVRPAYPVENGFEAEARKRIDEVERQMQEEEASLPPEEL